MTWISVKEAAKLLQITERAIQLAAQVGKYSCRYIPGIGRGGRQLMIDSDSLPPEAQQRMNAVEEPAFDIFNDFLSKGTGKQRQEADYHAQIVREFNASQMPADKFLQRFNEKNSENVTPSQQYRWKRKLESGGIAALIDQRGGHNKGSTTIPAYQAGQILYRRSR